jgi:hypothetical protein
MYSAIVVVHSLLRWVVILAGVAAVARAYVARKDRRTWTAADKRAGLFFTVSLDLQFLVGLALYVGLSPLTRAAFENFAAAVRNSGLRFWAVEHPLGMVIALALAHIGAARIRKAQSDARRHDLASMFYALALLVLLLSIPWPGLPNARPLFRWF